MSELTEVKIHEWPQIKKPLPKNADIEQRIDALERKVKELSGYADNLLLALLEQIKKGK